MGCILVQAISVHLDTEWIARGDSRPTSIFSPVASRLQGKDQGKGKKTSPIVSTPQKSQGQSKHMEEKLANGLRDLEVLRGEASQQLWTQDPSASSRGDGGQGRARETPKSSGQFAQRRPVQWLAQISYPYQEDRAH